MLRPVSNQCLWNKLHKVYLLATNVGIVDGWCFQKKIEKRITRAIHEREKWPVAHTVLLLKTLSLTCVIQTVHAILLILSYAALNSIMSSKKLALNQRVPLFDPIN